MIEATPIITEAGKILLDKAVSGEKIVFTRFKVGNGTLPWGATEPTGNDLVNTVLTFPITAKDTTISGQIKLTGKFTSEDVVSAFYWRELGIFAEEEQYQAYDGDGTTTTFTLPIPSGGTAYPRAVHSVTVGGDEVVVSSYNSSTGVCTLASAPASGTGNVIIYFTKGSEVLYGYAYDGQSAGIIRGDLDEVVSEHTVHFVIVIGDAEHVTAILSQSEIYVPYDVYNSHIYGDNPHNITKVKVGLGNVPNVTTNNQVPTFTVAATLAALVSGETLSILLGKVAKAVNDLISHISNKNNPHDVTAAQAGAASRVHEHSASDITSGTLPVERGGTGCTTIPQIKEMLAEDLSFVEIDEAYSKANPDRIAAKTVTVTGSKELIPSDRGTFQLVNSSGAVQITIPSGMAVDTEFEVCRYGTGAVTVKAASGVYLNTVNGKSVTLNAQFSNVIVKCVASNTWVVAGDYT